MASSDMKEALELERKIYAEMKAREDASRQREADETADMFNERELARLQDENRRLRAFVEELTPYQTYYDSSSTTPNGKLYTIGVKAAALLAGTPAEDSELAASDEWQQLSGVERLALRYAYDNGLVNSASNLGMFAECLRGLDDKGYLRPLPHVESGLLTDYKLTDIGTDLVEGNDETT